MVEQVQRIAIQELGMARLTCKLCGVTIEHSIAELAELLDKSQGKCLCGVQLSNLHEYRDLAALMQTAGGDRRQASLAFVVQAPAER